MGPVQHYMTMRHFDVPPCLTSFPALATFSVGLERSGGFMFVAFCDD
jgi:hypothetical protein